MCQASTNGLGRRDWPMQWRICQNGKERGVKAAGRSWLPCSWPPLLRLWLTNPSSSHPLHLTSPSPSHAAMQSHNVQDLETRGSHVAMQTRTTWHSFAAAINASSRPRCQMSHPANLPTLSLRLCLQLGWFCPHTHTHTHTPTEYTCFRSHRLLTRCASSAPASSACSETTAFYRLFRDFL